MGGVRKNVRSKWERAVSQYQRERVGWSWIDRHCRVRDGPGNDRAMMKGT